MCVCVCVFPCLLCSRSPPRQPLLSFPYLTYVPDKQISLCASFLTGAQTRSQRSRRSPLSIPMCLLFPNPLLLADFFGIPPPTPLNGSCSVNILRFFHNAFLATQSWDCRVTYTAMLLPGSPVSFPLRAWPRPHRLQDLSQLSLHKGVSRSAAAVGPHGSSRGRTSVREQGDPDRLQSRRLSFSVKTRALVRCFAPPPCVKASWARWAPA